MCPLCMATTAMLMASAVSTGGAAAVLVNKLHVKEIAAKILIFRVVDKKPLKEKKS
jgi:hypothetical protein